MALLWTAFGAVFGAGITPPGLGTVGAVSFAIAGIIVLAPIGIVLGFLGGQWKDTLLGGAVGMTAGAIVGVLASEGDLLYQANFGLLLGSLVSATCPALCRQMLRLLPIRS
jgi:hypothetical protein